MNRTKNAAAKFSQGYACSQAILSEYCEHFGLDVETALKLAAGFAGGMRFGEACGAVTGAYMVLGLGFGTHNSEKSDERKIVYDAVCEFRKRFETIHGSVNCESLIGCNLSTAEGMQKAKDEKIFQTVCPEFIKSAAGILDIMLDRLVKI